MCEQNQRYFRGFYVSRDDVTKKVKVSGGEKPVWP
jgi:hypothetical protein